MLISGPDTVLPRAFSDTSEVLLGYRVGHFEPRLEVVQVSVSFLIATLTLLIGTSLDKVKDAIDLRVAILRVTMLELLIREKAF